MVIEMFKKKRKASLTIELIIMVPLWLLLIFFISIESSYTSKVCEVEDDLRVCLRNAVKYGNEEDGRGFINTTLSSYGYTSDEYSIKIYKVENNKLTPVTYNSWSKNNIVEIVINTTTAMYKKGITSFIVNGNEFNFPRTTCSVSAMMIIEGDK